MKPSIITTLVPFALVVCVLSAEAQGATTPKPAQQTTPAGASLLGGALPGGAVISAAVVSVTPVGGGAPSTASVATDGTFSLAGLAPGRYRVALVSASAAKQTQGATFGEKVNAGLHAAGSAVAQGATSKERKHDTAKGSVGNIRGKEGQGAMPARISVNMTVGRQSHRLEVDGAPVDVAVGADGQLAGRVTPE